MSSGTMLAQIDHFDVEALFGLQLLGCFQRLQEAVGEGRQGQVLARTFDLRLADGHGVVHFGVGHIAAGEVEHLVLQEEHGIVVADGGDEQTLWHRRASPG